jgi:hypothetical protein
MDIPHPNLLTTTLRFVLPVSLMLPENRSARPGSGAGQSVWWTRSSL